MRSDVGRLELVRGDDEAGSLIQGERSDEFEPPDIGPHYRMELPVPPRSG